MLLCPTRVPVLPAACWGHEAPESAPAVCHGPSFGDRAPNSRGTEGEKKREAEARENQRSLEGPEQQRAASSVLTRLLIAGWGPAVRLRPRGDSTQGGRRLKESTRSTRNLCCSSRGPGFLEQSPLWHLRPRKFISRLIFLLKPGSLALCSFTRHTTYGRQLGPPLPGTIPGPAGISLHGTKPHKHHLQEITAQNKDVVLVPAALEIKNPAQSEPLASMGTKQQCWGHTSNGSAAHHIQRAGNLWRAGTWPWQLGQGRSKGPECSVASPGAFNLTWLLPSADVRQRRRR